MSKYMLIMRGTDESNAAVMADIEAMMAATRRFIQDTVNAGIYLEAKGLDDPSQGVVVHFGDACLWSFERGASGGVSGLWGVGHPSPASIQAKPSPSVPRCVDKGRRDGTWFALGVAKCRAGPTCWQIL